MNENEAKEVETILRGMFPEIANAELLDDISYPSYNDGGHMVEHYWKTKNKYYTTSYCDWCLESPWTTISEHTEEEVVKTIRTLVPGKRKYYGRHLNR